MSKPLTRSEWEALKAGSTRPFWDEKQRIEATIESGGFAPEPITERDLLAWLWAPTTSHEKIPFNRDFNQDDLGRALGAAARFGASPGIYGAPRNPGWVVEWNEAYYCVDLAKASRTLAAIAYREAKRPDAPDVSHLLGDQP